MIRNKIVQILSSATKIASFSNNWRKTTFNVCDITHPLNSANVWKHFCFLIVNSLPCSRVLVFARPVIMMTTFFWKCLHTSLMLIIIIIHFLLSSYENRESWILNCRSSVCVCYLRDVNTSNKIFCCCHLFVLFIWFVVIFLFSIFFLSPNLLFPECLGQISVVSYLPWHFPFDFTYKTCHCQGPLEKLSQIRIVHRISNK